MTDNRIFVHPEDAEGRLADMKATGAEFDATVETRGCIPRGQALIVDVGAIRAAAQRALERNLLGDLDHWRPIGIIGATSAIAQEE